MVEDRRMERYLGILHSVPTIQLAASTVLVIFWTLQAAGFDWLTLFSLSLQGAIVVGLGVLIYGFAAFRGAVGARSQVSYPLTGSYPYRAYYLVTPVLGGVICGIDYLVAAGALEGLRGVALGTIMTAFAVWVIGDPIIGITESLLPASRAERAKRRAQQTEAREQRERERRELIWRLREKRHARLADLRPAVTRHRERLLEILQESRRDPQAGLDAAASIGLELWRLGGVECMKEMYSSIMQACVQEADGYPASHLLYWWDGIGEWRQESTMREL